MMFVPMVVRLPQRLKSTAKLRGFSKLHFFQIFVHCASPPSIVSNEVQTLSLDSFDSTTHTKQSYGHYFIRNKKNIITTIQEDFRLIVL